MHAACLNAKQGDEGWGLRGQVCSANGTCLGMVGHSLKEVTRGPFLLRQQQHIFHAVLQPLPQSGRDILVDRVFRHLP